MDGGGVFFHRLFLDDSQHLQGGRIRIADMTCAVAARAGHMTALGKRRTQSLTGELHQTKPGDLAHLNARTIVVQRIFQAVFDLALVLGVLHVDEVDHDQTAQIAQAQLPGDFIGRFKIGVERGGFDVAATGRACGVDVHRDQCLGMVDHDGAAGGQGHGARVGALDLMLDLEAREQRHIVTVALDSVHHVRHHVTHELLRLFEDVVSVDQDFADIGLKVVADRADYQRRFLVDQESAGRGLAGAIDRVPQLHQVVQIPLQLVDVAADACRTGNDGHALWQVQFVHGLAQFLAIFALDAARHAATAWVVGHQHQIAAGQRNERGQGGALVTAFFFLDLHHDFLAFAQRFADAGIAHIDAVAEIAAGDFFEWQEAVALFAVIDEAGLERGLDTGDDAFVNVGFALFATGGLDIDVDEFLPIDDRHAQFFLLRGIEQHAFHIVWLRDPERACVCRAGASRQHGKVMGCMRKGGARRRALP